MDHPLLLLFLVLLRVPAIESSRGLVGVVYRVDIPGIPKASKVVPALVSAGVPRVRLVNADAADVASFVGADMKINLAVQNIDLFKSLASSFSSALKWVNQTIVPTHPQAGISSISVGHEIFTNFANLSHLVLPAVRNVHYACTNLSLTNISVSTSHSFDLITKVFPPSSAEISRPVQRHMKPLLDFLWKTGAAFEISILPFEVYRSKSIGGVTSSFVMFEAWDDDYLFDPATQCTYPNLYAVMVDAVIMALYKMSRPGMPITVAGTGWPSGGNKVTEPEASPLFAAEYNERLVTLINMRIGTPLRQNFTPVAYIYSLFDEPKRKGLDSYHNNWGIWHPDLTVKYIIHFATSAGELPCRPPNNPFDLLLHFGFLWTITFLLLLFTDDSHNRFFS